MKTKSTILGIALSLFSIGASAQCPTITALNVAYTTGSTATITSVITGTTNPATSHYVWSVSPSASLTWGYGSVEELTFPANGSYTVCLSIIDSSMVCSTTSSCTVINAVGVITSTVIPCNAAFSIISNTLAIPGDYYAYDLSTGTTLTYLWNFGDGTTSTLQFPSHTYSPPGSYVVCLTVNSGTTCTSTTCDSSSVTRVSASFLMSHFSVLAAPVNVKEINETISLKTFPNPMENDLTIDVSSKNEKAIGYILIDALGRTVMQGNLEDSKITISTTQLEQGFYSLSITNEKGSVLKNVKLLK